MENSVSRALIETVVRKALRDISDSPERSSRNLVDMALTFAEGRFQQEFFRIAQELLRDEHSVYYGLIRDAVAHVDAERLVTFGMNLGYNSCTQGARVIRENEAALHFDIPWSLTLSIDGGAFAGREAAYRSLIGQGKALGIYTWMLFADGAPGCVLPLIEEHGDCAFGLFCAPEAVTEEFLDDAEPLRNLMLVVRSGDRAEEACARLRQRRFLYSMYIPYGEDASPERLGDDLAGVEQSMHPLFTVFVARRDCPAQVRRRVCERVVQERLAPQSRTVLWELVEDGMFVDRIISEDACSAAVDANGDLYALTGDWSERRGNLFEEPLRDVLARAFPKGGGE